MYCQHCGQQLPDGAAFCPNCGAAVGAKTAPDAIAEAGQPAQPQQTVQHVQPVQPVQPQQTAPPNIVINNVNTNTNMVNGFGYVHKSKVVALVLCILLGGFGVHRFYVGKSGTGILWFFTMGMFGIGWVVDIILILTGGFRDKAGQPLM